MRTCGIERGGESMMAYSMAGQVLNGHGEKHSLYRAEPSGKRAAKSSSQG